MPPLLTKDEPSSLTGFDVEQVRRDFPILHRTVNDKPLRDEFPYLAEPHSEQPEESQTDWCAAIFWLIVLAIVVALILIWRRRAASDEAPYVRPYRER